MNANASRTALGRRSGTKTNASVSADGFKSAAQAGNGILNYAGVFALKKIACLTRYGIHSIADATADSNWIANHHKSGTRIDAAVCAHSFSSAQLAGHGTVTSVNVSARESLSVLDPKYGTKTNADANAGLLKSAQTTSIGTGEDANASAMSSSNAETVSNGTLTFANASALRESVLDMPSGAHNVATALAERKEIARLTSIGIGISASVSARNTTSANQDFSGTMSFVDAFARNKSAQISRCGTNKTADVNAE